MIEQVTEFTFEEKPYRVDLVISRQYEVKL